MNLQTPMWRWRSVWLLAGLVVLLFINQKIGLGQGHTQHYPWPSLQDISNSTLGFEKIFIINLPWRTDRHDALLLAAAATEIKLEFVAGTNASTLSTKYLPPGYDPNIPPGAVGAWKSHMDVLRQVVAQNLTTALIFEDDIDWDIRLKDSLRNFAIAANAVLYHPDKEEMSFSSLPRTSPPSFSPYGDNWDILWLGHCGTDIKKDQAHVLHQNDVTVPQIQHLANWPGMPDPGQLASFPQHSRLTGIAGGAICTFAYAVTQASARRLLYKQAVQRFDKAHDLMMSEQCVTTRCLSVIPPLFDNHRTQGSQSHNSDIDKNVDDELDKALTTNIRWSVRLNMEKLFTGRTDYDDQYPDIVA